MISTIYFNDKLLRQAYKINNVLAYGSLSAKLVSCKFPIAKESPQSSF